MAGSSYSIVDRLRGCYRAARTSPTIAVGEPAVSTAPAGRTDNPYGLAGGFAQLRPLLMMDRRARKDMIDATDIAEQIENAEAADPIEPTDRIRPNRAD
jgi:hypothetical protein